MSIVLALFNQSGGVGKSTLTMNLGYQFALQKRRVLLIDMDPQASLTTFMGLEPEAIPLTVYDALVDNETTHTVLDLPIQSHHHEMDLCPANINLSAAELMLVTADMRDVRLKDALEGVRDRYDVILIDCPPSLGLLSYISLVAATHVLVPIQTQFKAFAGTNLLLNTLARVKRRANRRLTIAGFVPTLFDPRRSQDDRTLRAIQERFSTVAPIYDPIPWSTGFADAAEARLPLSLYDKRHKAIASIAAIAQHLEETFNC